MKEKEQLGMENIHTKHNIYVYLYVSGLIKSITIYNEYMQIKLLLKGKHCFQ